MECRVSELRYKEIINVSDGSRYGWVGDVEVDLESGQVRALVGAGAPAAVWPAGPGGGPGLSLGGRCAASARDTILVGRHLPSAAWARGIEVARRGGDVVDYDFRV